MSILKNAVCPQHIPTYDGSDQSTHPSVLRFDAPWHGYLYWMAMTPYPYNNDGLEDPSILVSNDAQTWIVPEGLTNPLTPAPVITATWSLFTTKSVMSCGCIMWRRTILCSRGSS